jgi:hypothetical protein
MKMTLPAKREDAAKNEQKIHRKNRIFVLTTSRRLLASDISAMIPGMLLSDK